MEHLRQAVALWRSVGNPSQEADMLIRLGGEHAALGDHRQARRIWQQTLRMLRDQRRGSDVAELEPRLAALERSTPDG